MNFLEVGDKVKCTNGDEVKIYKVVERNDDVCSPPEYQFENVENGEKHGPVHWDWLKDAELVHD
jgi:hypothetical protein